MMDLRSLSMFGKLLKSVKIETINELGELCEVYFPASLYVELQFLDKYNKDLDLDKEIKDLITEIEKDIKKEESLR